MQLSKEDIQLAILFNSPDGQKVLKYLREMFYDRSVYTKGDPYHTAYQAGQQDVIGFIIQAIEEGD